MKTLRQTQGDSGNAGVSIIISIVFVSAFMLVIAGMAQVILFRIKTDANWYSSDKAFYLKESVEEVTKFYAAAHGVGADFDSEAVRAANSADLDLAKYVDPIITLAQELGIQNCADMDENAGNGAQSCVNFKIKGRAETADKITISGTTAYAGSYYSVPVKETGDVAETCVDMANADDDCNWNKIKIGESVEIPLYYDGSTNRATYTSDAKSFMLRVRTPCKEYQNGTTNCDKANRIILYPAVGNAQSNPFGNINKDNVLIQWTLTDAGGADGVLIAGDKKFNKDLRARPDDKNNILFKNNTEISSGRINDAANNWNEDSFRSLNDFVVLDSTLNGKDISNSAPVSIGSFIDRPTITKPILRISLVDQPRMIFTDRENASTELSSTELNNPQRRVPYLEYQFLSDKENVSDTKWNLEGYAVIGDFKKGFKSSVPLPVTAGGFAMESF